MIERERERRHARDAGSGSPRSRLRPPGDLPGRNFALAQAAAEAVLGELRSGARSPAVATRLIDPGPRSSWSPAIPPAIFDAAHNPDGAAALAEALPELAGGRAGRRLPGDPRRQGRGRDRQRPRAGRAPTSSAPRSRPSGSRARGGPAAARARRSSWPRSARRPGVEAEAIRGSAGAPGERARDLARERGRGRAGGRQPLPSQSSHMDREARSELLTMMGLVAVVVAVVILVFFALGYVFGLLFL